MTDVRFGLIGPLTVRCAGQSIAVPAARQRSLLAALLVRANEPVPIYKLCEAVWEEPVSHQSETTLRSYIMRLRRVLGPTLASRLVVRRPGYQLRLEQDDELDVLQFQGRIERGKTAALHRDWDQSMREFSQGLALWRGEPLCDVPSDTLHFSVLPVLAEQRTQAWEGLYTAAGHLGRAADHVVALQRLTEEDPLSERLSALLMSALAHGNRRIDALAEFRRLRHALISEHGVEPGKVVWDLHQRLLRDGELPDASHDQAGPITVGPPGKPIEVPRQIPRGAAGCLAGRSAEIDELVHLLQTEPDKRTLPPVAAIAGFPGIGKSELAFTVARLTADNFPDGQLYADLRGCRSGPLAPGEVAGQFLRALGVERADVAHDEDERLSQYRTVIAARRVLVVLDDAAGPDQVRPLLPGTGTCGSLVTSRRPLPHLSVARSLTLTALSAAESGDVLRALVGSERLACEPAAVSSIVAACGGLPLALHIAGARLAARPAWSIQYLAGLLTRERGRLDQLSYGGISVRESFETAVGTLASSAADADARAGAALPRLGQWRSRHITVADAAGLFSQSEGATAAVMEALADAGIVVPKGPGSYELHELMRLFAAEYGR